MVLRDYLDTLLMHQQIILLWIQSVYLNSSANYPIMDSECLPEYLKQSFTALKATNGWTKDVNGVISQWGLMQDLSIINNAITITFPLAFTTGCTYIHAEITDNTGSENKKCIFRLTGYTKTQVTLALIKLADTIANPQSIRWFAKGY